jgi:hypothetical protein
VIGVGGIVMPEDDKNQPSVVNDDLPGLDSFLKEKAMSVKQCIELVVRYTSDQISPEDKKILLIFFDEKVRRAGLMKRLYKKILLESVDFLDELPPAARRWSVEAYINFLKQMKREGLIQKLGER